MLAGCGSATRPGDLPQEFRVATFNVRNSDMEDSGKRAWSERRPVARTMLQLLNSDVLGLQEVSGQQRLDLDQDLIGYAGVGQGRERGGGGEQCPIYFRRELKVEARGMFWLSPTPLTPSRGWDAQLPRICTWIRCSGLTIFNAHLDHAGPQSRRESLRLIRRMARGSAVILGDFNESEGAPALEPVEELVDAFRALHPRVESDREGLRLARRSNTFQAFGKSRMTGRRIDFVFVTPDLQPLEAEIVRVQGRVRPSDHRALTVLLKRP